MHQAWANAWGVEPLDPHQPQTVAAEVARRLSLLDSQLIELDQRLRKSNPKLSVNTTTNQIHRYRLILANTLQHLGAPWGNVEPQLTPDLVKCLEFWDELIEPDEVVIASAELDSLSQQIREALAAAQSIENTDLRSAITSILNQLLNALADYQVGGLKAFQAAFREALAEVYSSESVLKANQNSDAVGAFGRVWARFVDVCQPLIFADNLLTAGGRFKEFGHQVMALIGQATS
ncbi:hypothetical protein [Cognatiluteimonas profundi]|uniref:hypothetical protein n=1 Tax=Cognatiluteimonas profundi TaxID=2594501 RepID=UPI00131C62FD|nr:hypothetical protein [Lysobacter profundi]